MAAIYVKEQGASIQKMGERIVVTKSSATLLDLPVIKIENLSVIGNVQITTQALRLLLENGVDINYFTVNGKYLGHTASDTSKNIFLRFEQHNFYLDDKRRLDMAKRIVDNKISNQIAIIQNYKWSSVAKYDWRSDVEQIQKNRAALWEKTTSNEVLGVEGICSSIYFSVFGKMLKGDFTFEKRNRRPPKDPVNIILSLAYTFLTREFCNALDAESFETYLGFLHGVRYGRKSLALDMMEEFRQPIVDRLTLLLFGKRMLGKYDFETDEDGNISLNEDGFRKFCTEYERWMTGRNVNAGDQFRKRIQEQVAALKKMITKGEVYQPYSWENRHVSDQLRSE